MCCFREAPRVKQAINQYEGQIDKIIVTCSKIPWEGNLKPDNTYELAKQTWAEVYEGEWKTEEEQRNFMLDKLRDYDWVIVAPPDRFFTQESFNNLKLFLQDAEPGIYGTFTLDYWKDFDTVIYPYTYLVGAMFSPFNKYGTPIYFEYANRLHDQPANALVIPGVTAHHITWVKTDEEVKSKIESYTHAKEILPNWYQDVWLNKSKDLTNFAPVTPHDYKKLVKYSLPSEIRKLWK